MIPWTVAYQAPLSIEFSRQEYQSGSPFPSCFVFHCTCHCRSNSDLGDSLLPPRGQGAAANGSQHHNCLCSDSWWWSLVSITIELLSWLLEGQFLHLPFAFQVSCENLGRMYVSSTPPFPRKEPGKCNPHTSNL